MRELDFISWIRSQSEFDPSRVPLGPGDDMAVVALNAPVNSCEPGRFLVTTDQVLDGTHFVLTEAGPQAAGRKAMARSLSDVAAMAAIPTAAVATVAMAEGMTEADARAIYTGLREITDAFDCPLVGGDVASWKGPLALTTTVFAVAGPKPCVLRSGAKPGDAIFVTGQLGASWRTKRHLTFTPRVADALELARLCEVHSMIDISDGLATDLPHICTASAVGAVIDAASLPIHPDVHAVMTDRSPVNCALCDGEDYELIFTVSQEDAIIIENCVSLPTPVTRIGTITENTAILIQDSAGQKEPLTSRGWEHGT